MKHVQKRGFSTGAITTLSPVAKSVIEGEQETPAFGSNKGDVMVTAKVSAAKRLGFNEADLSSVIEVVREEHATGRIAETKKPLHSTIGTRTPLYEEAIDRT